MTQQPQSSSTPSTTQPTSVSKAVVYLQWLGIFLFLFSCIMGIIGVATNSNITLAIVSFVISCAGIPLSILQINKNAFSFILRTKKMGVQMIGILILLVSLGTNFYLFNRHATTVPPWHPSVPTVSPTSLLAPSVAVQIANSPSSLIPVGKQPIVNDPLGSNGQGYQWDTGENAQKTGRCDFFQGLYYLVSAPAESNVGIGCNTEDPKGKFSNFVYQIKMTILQGIDDGNAEVGPTFRVSDTAQYQVSFDQNGYWSVNANSVALSKVTTPFPYFNIGIDQPNFITIRAFGSSLKIQVNGHDLGSYTDTSNTSGFIGVEMSPGSSAGKVAFSDVQVWQLS